MAEPVIIGSERSEAGLAAGMETLRRGGSALDAVEVALRACEDNLDDHYVGTSGLPNAQGVVELDASVMTGSDRRFGAVAALRGYPHPVSVARAVLERLPQHSLLVGEGAAMFAKECGFGTAELLTETSRRLWRERLAAASAESVEGENTAATSGDRRYRQQALDLVRRLPPHDGPWGTINVIALDASGEMCVGVSTSGYPYKYPGRVGDSAVPGAGNWCDLRAGGAACTGRGELAMRGGTARTVVDLMAGGADPAGACAAALREAAGLPDDFRAELRALALAPDGRHGGASGQRGSVYQVMTAACTQPRTCARRVA
ncbi:isoaspartyl peptidase/L-asparaginase [Streptomyces sp. SL13]|uniref:Isoaspartyl peptidase/L-asparaginase n=1 Tax=Streptantibioticus silvisoli TaxID=2705255 RepID=A0AA90HBL1_9ACTN|nr:isoaspartyl peptidase/L-asparaginase [Streptantibioticus silvisoli]MDI5974333.1 isoaspartyl peptidase/L-asparaginase [Streptantibioticus silvisoli]